MLRADCIVLLRDYHDHEGAWLHCRSPRCSGFGVLEFCGGQIDPVCGGVYSHCPCSLGRFYGLDNLELSGRGFAGYGERAVTAAGEGLTCVDLRGMDAAPDGQIGWDLAGVGAHDDQFLWLSATDEEAARFGVDGHPDGRPTGCYGPTCDDFSRLEVHDGYFVFVFEIDIKL